MNLKLTRSVELYLSEGNVNDAFTSLLLATGHIHNNEEIMHVALLPKNEAGLRPVIINLKGVETK